MRELERRGISLRPNVTNYFLDNGYNVQSKDPGMNPLFAIDTETTGLNHNTHEIIDICIMPLNCDGTQNKDHKVFNLYIKPTQPKGEGWPQFMHRNYDRALRLGCTKKEALEAFLDWHKTLNLEGKIAPVGHNYTGFDKDFIRTNLFPTAYEDFFDYHVYDTMAWANFYILQCLRKQITPPFRKASLGVVAAGLGIIPDPTLEHTAYGDCVTTARVLHHVITKL